MQNPWNIRYSAEAYVYGTAPNDFLVTSIDHITAGGNVLCLAEGEGRNGVFLAKKGFRVTGVDASRVGLEKARRLAAANGVSLDLVVADLNDYRIAPGEWDAVVSIFCHLPTPLRTRVYTDAVAGLKPGGVFIMEAYTPKQLLYKTGGPPTLDLLYDPDALCEELAELTLEVFQEVEREVREGQLHRGHAAVLQVIGKK